MYATRGYPFDSELRRRFAGERRRRRLGRRGGVARLRGWLRRG